MYISEPPKLPQRRLTQPPISNPPQYEVQRRKNNSFTEIKPRPRPNPIKPFSPPAIIPPVPPVPQVPQAPPVPPRQSPQDGDDLMSFNAPNQKGFLEKLDALYEQKPLVAVNSGLGSNGFNPPALPNR